MNDPNRDYQTLLELCEDVRVLNTRWVADTQQPGDEASLHEVSGRLQRLVLEFNHHLSRGGRPPRAWCPPQETPQWRPNHPISIRRQDWVRWTMADGLVMAGQVADVCQGFYAVRRVDGSLVHVSADAVGHATPEDVSAAIRFYQPKVPNQESP